MRKLTSLLILTSVISGCAHQPKPVHDTACVAFEIIHPSRLDTADTKRQVLAHNSTYRRLCPVKK